MRFESPQVLWLLLVVPPAMIAFFRWSVLKRRRLMGRFIEARLLPGLISGISGFRRQVRLSMLVLAAALLIVALARPQWGFVWEEVKQRGLDIVIAMDVSKSMLAQDIAPNRLARAKLAALDLMQQARTDRLGLVGFAGSAFLQCPLTIDDAAFRHSLEALDITSVSPGGTALADAIDVAQTAFKEGEAHKVLVVITDGEDHDSGAVEAARKAAAEGLQIFTIGVGTPEGELLRIVNDKGQPDYVRDPDGNVVKSRLNEDLLRELAGASQKGFYLPLRGAKTIDTLYEQGLAPLPKADNGEKLVRRYYERFQWPLGLAILLLGAEMFVPERKRHPRASAAPLPSPTSAPAVAAVAALLALSSLCAFASPSRALRDYRAGNFDESLAEYHELLKKNPDDPRLHFNAGAAAYRNRDFREAEKRFDRALISPDLKLQEQAYYNRGNSRYWLGEDASDPAERQKAWQQALKDFENSLKLNAEDTDAKNNLEFVRRRLEELKQQQSQSQQDQKQSPEQSQEQQQQQSQQSQNGQEQNRGQDQQPEQSGADQQQQPHPSPSQPQNQQDAGQPKQDEQQPQPQPGEPKDQQAQQAQLPQQGQNEKEQPASASGGEDSEQPDRDNGETSGPMTPDQARQLLDAQKGDEKVLPMHGRKSTDPNRPVKDW